MSLNSRICDNYYVLIFIKLTITGIYWYDASFLTFLKLIELQLFPPFFFRPKSGRVDQHCRDVTDHRRRGVCDRPRIQQAESVQPPHPCRVTPGVAHLQSLGPTEGRPCRPDKAGQVFQAVHGEGIQKRDAGQHLPWDPQVQPGLRCPSAEKTRNRRLGENSFWLLTKI